MILKNRLLLIFFFIGTYLNINAGVFDTLRTVEPKKRESIVGEIFRNKIKPLPVEVAFKELDELLAFAKKEKDEGLVLYALQLKGFYCFNTIPALPEQGHQYYLDAIKLAEKNENNLRPDLLMHELGFNLFINRDYAKGFGYLLRADEKMKAYGYENISGVYRNLHKMAMVYSELKNYSKAIIYYEKAIEFAAQDSFYLMAFYNDVGLIYNAQKLLDKAQYSFEKIYTIAQALNDTSSYALAAGNLGDIFLQKGQLDTATTLLEKDYRLSLEFENWRSAFLAQLTLVHIDIKKNKTASAISRMEDAKQLMLKIQDLYKSNFDKFHDHEIWIEYYKQLAYFNFHIKNTTEAFLYLDSFVVLNDSINLMNDDNMLVNLETQIMAEKHLNDLLLLEKEQKYQRLIRNVIIVSFLLIVLFAIRFFVNFKKKKKMEQVKLQLKQRKTQQELNKAKSELTQIVSGLREKNLMIEQFKQELEHLKNDSNSEKIKERQKTIEDLTHANILTDDDWRRFRKMFEEVYQGFFTRLELKYPELTDSEVRLLALFKINLSNHEIASMIGISSESVRQTSFRLRKKLNIATNADLLDFAENI
jgi:tetratricopeptide (TPR) repeat protein